MCKQSCMFAPILPYNLLGGLWTFSLKLAECAESLLSLCRSRPTQPKINFMWEICTYCSSMHTSPSVKFLNLILETKSKTIYKSFFLFEVYFVVCILNGQQVQVLITSFLFMCFCDMSWDGLLRHDLNGSLISNWHLILLFQQFLRNERLFSFVIIKIPKTYTYSRTTLLQMLC